MNVTATRPSKADADKAAGEPRLGRWVAAAVVVLLVGLVAGLVPRWMHRHDLEADTAELAVPYVIVVSAAPGKSESSMSLPAEMRPFIEAPIYARANGFITDWKADIGAKVQAGQFLADIDTPDLDAELAAARANLVEAEAAQDLAKVTADRWADLLKTDSVSAQENAEKAADLKLKIAEVDAAKATVQRYEDLKAFAHVVAPFAGTVIARDIDVGDLISSGKEMFRLADTSTLRVFVQVPQSGTPGVEVGADADITVPEMPDRKFAAKVVRTAGAIDANTRTLLTELDVPNPDGQLTAGAYAQVSFHDLKKAPALTLPSNTLLFRAEGPQVGVVTADGRVELRSLTLGRDLGPDVEVLAGVSAADRVILNPSDSLVSGAQVRVAGAGAAELGTH